MNVILESAMIQIKLGRGASYNCSQEDGERRLNELARSAKLEDAWIFSEGLWKDIGYMEEPHSVRLFTESCDYEMVLQDGKSCLIGCTLDDLLDFIPSTNSGIDNFSVYHLHCNHPIPGYDTLLRSPPSISDVYMQAILKNHFRKSRPDLSYANRIVDSLGVWSYDLSAGLNSALEIYGKECLIELSQPYIKMGHKLKNQPLAYDSLLDAALSELRGMGVEIEYRRFQSK